MGKDDALWVFGYGSLVWNPGIEVAETRLARLSGFRRRFCMLSIHHRGSEDDPGLVLALEAHAGATCTGLAIRAAKPDEALEELRARELISSAYYEAEVSLSDDGGAALPALAYVIDTNHRQYVPDMTLEQQAQVIARAHGGRGPNHEYLSRTAHGLNGLGIGDADLDWLVARVQQIRSED
ncbi:gamma-glutamylcyclotransferase [Jannaschia pagri]|uniref:glutathione-specific gamma-glutamylcyclotransferase n=1 Tax=Jannaschia pagri TaxID=2829797 RepID=A0ABQ4NKR3_9RHOB|nr:MULTISPECIES: gamma-glutamylcyclotransferase [unclassified Jannaschia]GIT91181.1 gamma-glutamylcyclotransferase [Jannaschia sp. AI_61]GIT95013.1 gamma-glutamylcyclotransferase [Jannaschia sp. AI_62]